ncbi:hypothetical protein [Paenibacillus sp. IITD108]|uniref:hypothetical protein n=1 Tax=Paenibacillus sp. IITD108 TaxID=3116649 RepID=UPI002F3F1A7C
MNCTQCKKEMDERYIIDAKGTIYCSEDCMDQYMEERESSYDSHPYEDTYLILRRGYIDLLDHWEDTLNKEKINLELLVDELLEEIDELIDDHSDFIRAEGDDGPYAWEIYQYTLKLRELQKYILAWRPNRKMLYWVTGMDTNYGSLDKNQEGIYDKICMDLYLTGYEDFILYVIKIHQHPYHWGLDYVFDNLDMAKEAYEILKPFCDKYGVELSIVESYKCEAHCEDVLEADADTYINGFFYCYSCSESQERGVFTLLELKSELTGIEKNNEERQEIIEERKDWVAPFKRKIKRSCRTYGIDTPSWVE